MKSGQAINGTVSGHTADQQQQQQSSLITSTSGVDASEESPLRRTDDRSDRHVEDGSEDQFRDLAEKSPALTNSKSRKRGVTRLPEETNEGNEAGAASKGKREEVEVRGVKLIVKAVYVRAKR